MPRIRQYQALVFFVFASVGICAIAAQAHAGQANQPAIPDALAPWVDWVMYDAPDLDCPQVEFDATHRVCAWPGTLQLDADPDGAQFEMRVWMAQRGDVALPGDDELWPQEVRVDGQRSVVKQFGSTPMMELETGTHVISGHFTWNSIPQYVPAPASTGRVVLTLNGSVVDRPHLDADGRLWLEKHDLLDDADESDRVRTSIYRRIEDGSPIHVVTRIELNVSGKAREIELGNIFVQNSRTTAIDSSLPVDIDSDDNLTVYARPGTHELTLRAVIPDNVDRIAVPDPGLDFYDDHEVWVWIPDDLVRTTELSGLLSVDPARTSLPQPWHGHTTYIANPGDVLNLEITRRGVTTSPNAVALNRQIWFDVEGKGLTIRDRLTGTLQQQWRLDYAGAAQLGRAYEQQVGEDMLITENPQTGRSGVELRDTNLDLVADLRLDDATTTLPAVGWDHDVRQLSTTLHLPPGWTLLTARGVDTVQGAWLSDSWTLWHFFFILMVALAIGKLLGWRWAPVAIFALLLSHGYDDAPMWTWIHLVASLALLRALPDGWWRKAAHIYRVITLLVLFVVLASFAHHQVRSAIHPQINAQAFHGSASHYTASHLDSAPRPQRRGTEAPMDDIMGEEMGMMEQRVRDAASPQRYSKLDVSKKGKKLKLNQVDPNAVVQTGAGTADWSWSQWYLSWSGPVHRDHEIRLWLISPTFNRLLTFLRIALLIVLALVLLSPRDMAWTKRDGDPDHDGDSDGDGSDDAHQGTFWRHLLQSSGVALVCLATLSSASIAHAEDDHSKVPVHSTDSSNISVTGMDHDLLQTLRKRLIAAQTCDASCVVASHADLAVDGRELTLIAEVHAQMDAGWHLPGPTDSLRIESVHINGVETSQFRRQPGGLTAVRIPAGTHTVEIVGQLANREVNTLRFDDAARPKKVSFDSTDWTVDGLSAGGIPDSSLQLARTEDAQDAAIEDRDQAQDLPPWYQIDRFLGLGIPWQLQTTITRSDASRSRLVRIPLLDGESVITDGPRIEDGEVLVDFSRGEHTVAYRSEIPVQDQVELTAATDQPWSENWTVECSRIWRCHFSELPPITWIDEEDGTYRPTWKPWPAESLTIDVERPAGAEGQSSTVDDVQYRITPGKRLLEASLQMTIRASEDSSQTVTLPANAEIQSTTVDGREHSLRFEDRELSLPIRPGEHTYTIEWNQPWEPAFVEHMPQIDIGAEATNIDLYIEQQRQRWLLHAMGPTWGPAILFWPHLVMLIIIALLLNALRGLPLKPYEWILLILGMSQLPYIALIPIVAWFAVLTLRKKSPADAWWKFDIVQLFIVGLTLVAAITLYAAIHTNLLVDVDMQVRGTESTNHLLHWYIDRGGTQIGDAAIVSVPIFFWRILMLAWAFWLVSRLLAWLPWGWSAFSEGGLWRWRKEKGGEKEGDEEEKEEPQSTPAPPETDGQTEAGPKDTDSPGDPDTGTTSTDKQPTSEVEQDEEKPVQSTTDEPEETTDQTDSDQQPPPPDTDGDVDS